MTFTNDEILSKIDHTLLSQTAVWDQIKVLCDEGMRFHTATVCISPCFVRRAKEYVKNALKICTVIGFPNGCSTMKSKCFEAADAVNCGADEVDAVINIGALKEKRYDFILDEINRIKKFCDGRTLKIIIETCLLSNDEKIDACLIVSQSEADFIKTSTGFSKSGATVDDILLLRKYCQNKKIKAAGGIKSVSDAVAFLEAGADRIGTSSLLKMLAP
ncbi:MAG: deoxyribose-phosphate aldolase [Clostridia bacterium]